LDVDPGNSRLALLLSAMNSSTVSSSFRTATAAAERKKLSALNMRAQDAAADATVHV
jgi:hypothetical protein